MRTTLDTLDTLDTVNLQQTDSNDCSISVPKYTMMGKSPEPKPTESEFSVGDEQDELLPAVNLYDPVAVQAFSKTLPICSSFDTIAGINLPVSDAAIREGRATKEKEIAKAALCISFFSKKTTKERFFDGSISNWNGFVDRQFKLELVELFNQCVAFCKRLMIEVVTTFPQLQLDNGDFLRMMVLLKLCTDEIKTQIESINGCIFLDIQLSLLLGLLPKYNDDSISTLDSQALFPTRPDANLCDWLTVMKELPEAAWIQEQLLPLMRDHFKKLSTKHKWANLPLAIFYLWGYDGNENRVDAFRCLKMFAEFYCPISEQKKTELGLDQVIFLFLSYFYVYEESNKSEDKEKFFFRQIGDNLADAWRIAPKGFAGISGIKSLNMERDVIQPLALLEPTYRAAGEKLNKKKDLALQA